MEYRSASIPLRKQIRNVGRLAQIVNIFAKHGYWTVIERLEMRKVLTDSQMQQVASEFADAKGKHESTPPKMEGIPSRFRRALEELGPAFVKLGQVLAVREDLLPKEFTEELCKLHSNVDSLPYSLIKQRLIEELGEAKMKAFRDIDPVPLAAGSVAQAHTATLTDGSDVVIKIQRPGIKNQIEIDLDLMAALAQLLEKYIPEIRFINPSAIVKALSDALLSELDFVREAGSTEKMAGNFSEVTYVHFPKVHWDLSTQRILTLSKIEGIPTDDRTRLIASNIDVKTLVSRGLGMFMKMVFVDGFFHGDLHPGNLLAKPNSEIGLIDFGLSIRMSVRTRENLAGLLMSLAKEDYEGMVNYYLELADPSPSLDISQFQHDVANAVAPFVGLSLRHTQNGALLWDLARIAAKHNSPFPQDLIIFVKTLATLEGVGAKLDPDFNIMHQIEEFASELVGELYSPKRLQDQALVVARDLTNLLRFAPTQARRLLNAALEGQLRLTVASPDVLRLTKSLDRTGSRIAIAMIIAALLIGSSILTYASAANQPSTGVIGIGGFILAGVLGFYIVISMLRSGKL
jgi:ubiquinone biosynthesis protein